MFPNCYKSIITPGLALFVFLGILILALLISLFCNPRQYDLTRTKIFISCLAGLGIVVTFLFYYSLVVIQQSQQRYDIILLTSKINNKLLHGVMDELITAQKCIPYFISSLFPLMPKYHHQIDNDTPENCLLKHHVAMKLFFLWQEFIVCTPFIDLDVDAYLCHFLQRAHSSLLKQEWDKCKLEFNDDTQQFAELLFHHASKITDCTLENFHHEAKCMQHCHQFIKLMSE